MCWLNSDVMSATGRVQYVISFAGNDMTSLLLWVVSVMSHNMRCHALGHTWGWYNPLKGKEVPTLWGGSSFWLKASSYKHLAGRVHGH